MTTDVLFIQGAGEGAYVEDGLLAANLRELLGVGFEVRYPVMPNEGQANCTEWSRQIAQEVSQMRDAPVLVGHSVGGSILMKWLAETKLGKPIAAICLIAAPFWGGEGWRYEGYQELELPEDLAARLRPGSRVLLFQCRDDEIVPFGHLALYARLLPEATICELDEGGHQLNNDLSQVADRIKGL
jgi:predicted alpha/beta hydrolase family esterase